MDVYGCHIPWKHVSENLLQLGQKERCIGGVGKIHHCDLLKQRVDGWSCATVLDEIGTNLATWSSIWAVVKFTQNISEWHFLNFAKNNKTASKGVFFFSPVFRNPALIPRFRRWTSKLALNCPKISGPSVHHFHIGLGNLKDQSHWKGFELVDLLKCLVPPGHLLEIPMDLGWFFGAVKKDRNLERWPKFGHHPHLWSLWSLCFNQMVPWSTIFRDGNPEWDDGEWLTSPWSWKFFEEKGFTSGWWEHQHDRHMIGICHRQIMANTWFGFSSSGQNSKLRRASKRRRPLSIRTEKRTLAKGLPQLQTGIPPQFFECQCDIMWCCVQRHGNMAQHLAWISYKNLMRGCYWKCYTQMPMIPMILVPSCGLTWGAGQKVDIRKPFDILR